MTGIISPKQAWSVHQAKQQTITLWTGAVSAGKTFASLFAFFDAVHEHRGDGLIVIAGKTLPTIERNIVELAQRRDLYGTVARNVEHTRGSSIARVLGKEVHLVGANDSRSEEKIRGATVEVAYVDEATVLPEGFWDMLGTRLRVPHPRMLATTNPGSSQHWLRTKWIQDRGAKDMAAFRFTMDDNPSLTEAYRARMKASYKGTFYDRMILGKWTNAEGAVYDIWNPSQHVIAWEQLPPIRRLFGVALDYGTTHPTAAIMLALGYDRCLYAVDELRIEASDASARYTDAQQSRIFREWLAKNDHLPVDNANWLRPEWLIADQAGASFRVQLSHDGVDTHPADKDVDYGIGLVASLLGRGKLRIAAKSLDGKHGCPGLIKEFPEYVWNAKKAEKGIDEPDKARGGDDSLDALRYSIATLESQWREEIDTTPAF